MVTPDLTRKLFWITVATLATALPCAHAQSSPFTSGAWCGNVSATSATVNVRFNASGLRVRLGVTTSDKVAPIFSVPVTTAVASGNVASLDITGLTPNTDYFYGIEVNGVTRTESGARGKFHTFPLGAASFRIAFASCGDFRDPDQRAFDALVEEQPMLLIHMGDLHYSDTNSGIPDDYRHNYDAVLNHANEGPLYRSVALAYVWDDHDFCGDNSDGNAFGAGTARAIYREYVPHYPLNIPGGTVGQSFTIGRVRVIMTDLHSASNNANLPESPTKTRLGAEQKAWFKQELISARDGGFPVIFWVSTDPWIDAPAIGADSWGAYATERTEIANFIRDNRIKNLVILSGDMHALAYDDGTHSDYATGGGAPLVVLQAAALTREPNIKGGPYTAGPIVGSPQYGILEITDTGGPKIGCQFIGKRVGEGAKLVLQFSASTGGVDSNIVPVSDGLTNRALINISARGHITTPTDTLIAGFVIAGNTPRSILLRAAGPTLAAFGVTDAIARPALVLFKGSTIIASNSDWGLGDVTRLTAAFDRAGAFRYASPASHDAAMLLTLQPGTYTMQAGGVSGAQGSIVVEAYEVP